VKFLDFNNCQALLANISKDEIKALDEHMQMLNKSGTTKHAFSKMVEHNKKTVGAATSDERLFQGRPGSIIIHPGADTLFHDMVLDKNDYPEGPYGRTFKISLQTGGRSSQGSEQRVLMLRIPIQFLMKGWGDANVGHQGYSHSLVQLEDHTQRLASTYIGITGRNWLIRLQEHLDETFKQNSNKLFHYTLRNSFESKNKLPLTLNSQLLRINMSYDDAMNWEEDMVANTLTPDGLNMIPGGYEGMKYLHTLRVTDKTTLTLDERDDAEKKLVQLHPRLGIPNEKVAQLWKNDEHYLKVIGSRDKTLSPDQVFQIRHLSASGKTPENILSEVGALNVQQVKRVISGKTYTRMI